MDVTYTKLYASEQEEQLHSQKWSQKDVMDPLDEAETLELIVFDPKVDPKDAKRPVR